MLDKLFPPYSGQTKLIALATLCVVFFLAGWTVHGWKTDAGLARSITATEKTRYSDEGAQGVIVNDKLEKQEAVRTVFKTIKEKVYVQDDRAVCFTDESLQLWNSAIGANADIHRRESTGGAEATEISEAEQKEIASKSNEPGDDPVATVRDVLINATDNFEICTDNSVKHLALIDRVRSLQGKMCYCSN